MPNTDISYTYGTTVLAIGSLYLIAAYASSSSADYSPATTTYAEW